MAKIVVEREHPKKSTGHLEGLKNERKKVKSWSTLGAITVGEMVVTEGRTISEKKKQVHAGDVTDAGREGNKVKEKSEMQNLSALKEFDRIGRRRL